jgi:putative FmdB family regulatory protein
VPTYQYACTECGHAFEQVQTFSDDALAVCPECEGKLRKVFNAVGVVFKGSGFYRTDSRADTSATDGATAKSETKTETKTKSETKSESKPAPAAASSSSSSSD